MHLNKNNQKKRILVTQRQLILFGLMSFAWYSVTIYYYLLRNLEATFIGGITSGMGIATLIVLINIHKAKRITIRERTFWFGLSCFVLCTLYCFTDTIRWYFQGNLEMTFIGSFVCGIGLIASINLLYIYYTAKVVFS
jgi:hypothetical protein